MYGHRRPGIPSTMMRRRVRRRRAVWVATFVVIHSVGFTHASATAGDGGATRGSVWAPADQARVRKNVTSLTPTERREFVEAVLALKAVSSPYDAHLSYYDQFVAWHLALYPCGMGHQMMH